MHQGYSFTKNEKIGIRLLYLIDTEPMDIVCSLLSFCLSHNFNDLYDAYDRIIIGEIDGKITMEEVDKVWHEGDSDRYRLLYNEWMEDHFIRPYEKVCNIVLDDICNHIPETSNHTEHELDFLQCICMDIWSFAINIETRTLEISKCNRGYENTKSYNIIKTFDLNNLPNEDYFRNIMSELLNN